MAYVKFKDCIVDGANVIDEWLSEQPEEVRAEFLSLLDILENVPIKFWKRRSLPHKGYKKMRGRYEALRQFYVDVEGRPYRLGAYRGSGLEMILLSGWIHDSEQAQRVGMEEALVRRDLVRTGRAGRVDHV